MFRRLLVGAAGVLFVGAFSLHVQAAEFLPLGGFPDGPYGTYNSNVSAVSNNGAAVVAIRFSHGPESFPSYLWTETDGRTFLGDPLGPFSFANGVTDDAQFVVGTHRIEQPGLYEQAFTWTPTTGMAPLAGLPNGATHSEANDVTPDGTSIVGVTNLGTPDATEFEAFRLSNTGELLLLGDLPGGQHLSLATAVSADGRTITGGSMSDAGYDAFAWTPETGMVGLGEALVGMTSSDGRDISADGRVIVGVGYFASGTDGRAFRWTNELGMQLLGVVPGYESGNGATAVSGDGSIIVGTASNDNGNGFANLSAPFVWDKFHGVRNLQQVLEEDYALATELSGWKLMAAVDISADGLSIVGNGVDPDGIQEAWLVRLDRPLTAPEPSTSALLLIIAMSLFTACRRRSRWSLRNTITR